jgi:hypothetical protein
MDNENGRNFGKRTDTRREQGSGVTRVGRVRNLRKKKSQGR